MLSIITSGLLVTLYGGHGLQLSEDSEDSKRDWVRRAQKYAVNYFNGDLQKMTFCLKDCHNLHKWTSIEKSLSIINPFGRA